MVLKDLINFAKRPEIGVEHKVFKNAIGQNVRIFLINLILGMIGSGIATLIIIRFGITNNSITQNINCTSALVISFINFLMVPLMEELECRLYLIFKPINISITFLVISFSLVSFFGQSPIYELNNFLIINFAISALISVSVYLVLSKVVKARKFCERIWVDYFKYIFYFSVITFGIIHLKKYFLSSLLLYLISPLLIMPQLTNGIILGYIRVRFGLSWSILHHIIYNICFYIPSLIIWHLK